MHAQKENVQTTQPQNHAIASQKVEKLEAEEIRTIKFLTYNCPQEASFESERLVCPKVSSSGNTFLYLSLDHVMIFSEMSLDREAKMAIFSVKTYIAECIIWINSSIQAPLIFFFQNGGRLSSYLKTNVFPILAKSHSALERFAFANKEQEILTAQKRSATNRAY